MTPCSNRSEKPSACESVTGRVSKTMVMRRSSSDVNSRTVKRRDRAVAFNRCALSRPAVDSLAVQTSRGPRRVAADAIRLHSSAANATHRRSVPAWDTQGYPRCAPKPAPPHKTEGETSGEFKAIDEDVAAVTENLFHTLFRRRPMWNVSKVSERTLFITRPARLALVLVDRSHRTTSFDQHRWRRQSVAWCCVASQSPARLLRQRCDPEAGRDFQIAQRVLAAAADKKRGAEQRKNQKQKIVPGVQAANPTTTTIDRVAPPVVISMGRSKLAISSRAERANGGTMRTRISPAITNERAAPMVASVLSLVRQASSVTVAAASPASTSNVPRIALRQ